MIFSLNGVNNFYQLRPDLRRIKKAADEAAFE